MKPIENGESEMDGSLETEEQKREILVRAILQNTNGNISRCGIGSIQKKLRNIELRTKVNVGLKGE